MCALAMARAGADVIVAAANEMEGREAVAAIRPQAAASLVRFERLDLASLASVANFAARMMANGRGIDLLMNMGGASRAIASGRRQQRSETVRQLTADGFELELGANYLSHFALTAQLLPLLRRGRQARVVQLSSLSQRDGAIEFDDLQMERSYDPARAYAQSKLAALMFALELQRRSDAAGWGILSVAAHPGYARTEPIAGGRYSRSLMRRLRGTLGSLMRQSAVAAARPALFAATAPTAQRGGYYGPIGAFELAGPPGLARLGRRARDAAAAARLWEISERLTGVKWPAG